MQNHSTRALFARCVCKSILASTVFFAVSLFGQTAEAQWGSLQNPTKVQQFSWFKAFNQRIDGKGNRGHVALIGPNYVFHGGKARLTNTHLYPVIVSICDIEGENEIVYGVLLPGEVIDIPINDDPRAAGTQFILKVESIINYDSLVLGII